MFLIIFIHIDIYVFKHRLVELIADFLRSESTFLLYKNHLIPILLVGNDFQRHLQCSKMLLLMKEVKKQCLVEELEWGGSYKHYGEKLLPRFVDLGVMHLLPVQCDSFCFRTTTNCSLFTKSSNQETQQDCYEYHSLS